jgi:hypothetical protein
MFKNENYQLLEVRSLKNGADLFYYLWVILFLPIVFSVLFSGPVYYLLKIKTFIYFILLFCVLLVLEYVLYSYLASEANLYNGIFNVIIGVILFFFMFYKRLPLSKKLKNE